MLRQAAENADGIIHTAFGLDMTQIDDLAEEDRQAIETFGDLSRMGRPEEIASAALYFASDDSRFITGAELLLDGGYTDQ